MRRRLHGSWLVSLAAVALLSTAAAAYVCLNRPAADETPELLHGPNWPYAGSLQIQFFCSRCHVYPEADTLPRAAWKQEIEQAYRFFEQARLPLQPPRMDLVIRYYERAAPAELPLPDLPRASGPPPVGFRPMPYAPPSDVAAPAVSNVNLVHLFDERRLDVLACDLRAGLVLALSPYA